MAEQNYTRGQIAIDPILGLPPTGYISDDLKMNSMPIAEVIPCTPEFRPGLSIFSLRNDWSKYQALLTNAGYRLSKTPLKLAFLADNFPTDTFSNEYGESFLQKMTDVASEGMASISQFFGSRKLTGLGSDITNALKKQGGLVGTVGGGLESATRGLKDFGTTLAKEGGRLGQVATRVGEVANTLLSGARVDFPSVWKNSAYAPSYTMTVRLYNPNPESLEDTRKYIIGPIAAILLLGLPQSEDGNTYNWPFFSKVKVPGIYNLSPAFISNIAVIKGGDQQQIAFNQRLGIVDVRIDFGSLYNSILVGGKGRERPTLKTYLQAMESEKKATSGKDLQRKPNTVSIPYEYTNVAKEEKARESELQRLALNKRKDALRAKGNSGHTQHALTTGEVDSPPSRVTTDDSNKYASLYSDLPSDFSLA